MKSEKVASTEDFQKPLIVRFAPLTTKEHMVLLMIFENISFSLSEYESELKLLSEKAYIQQSQNGWFINKRGQAFVHQQRNPYIDIQRIINNPSTKFKRELLAALSDNLRIQCMFDELVQGAIEKSKKIKNKN